MRTFLTFCGLLLFFHSSFAQQTKRKHLRFAKQEDHNCNYLNKYNPATRRTFYPFNIADTIKLVAFYDREENFPIRKDTLLKDSLIQVKILNNEQVDSLTDILYNNFYKEYIPTNIGSITMCFVPHNAILFFDKTGKLKEYFLICFHCKNIERSSFKINFGSDRYQKTELLRQFFISHNINFGTDVDKDYGDGRSDVVAPDGQR